MSAEQPIELRLHAAHVREARAELGLTRSQLAAALGVTYTTVRRWEAAEVKPQPGHLERLRTLVADTQKDAAGS